MSETEPAAACFTLQEFCRAHKISRAHFYALQARGTGPKVMRAGSKVLVSLEAAAEWRRERETVLRK
jgi:hypothetical protein